MKLILLLKDEKVQEPCKYIKYKLKMEANNNYHIYNYYKKLKNRTDVWHNNRSFIR